MTIAEVSKKYDITPDTLRYYERVGLLTNVPRNPNGIRNYDEQACKRIEKILQKTYNLRRIYNVRSFK